MISERISDDILPQNETFEYGYPHPNAILQFCLNFEPCKPHNTAYHPNIYDVIKDVKLYPTVYRRIYCRKFWTLSNQTSRYKSKCIRMHDVLPRFENLAYWIRVYEKFPLSSWVYFLNIVF